jgi:hypothetical protein
MFKQNKWTAWYNAQPDHIKSWIDQPRAIWYDSDMLKAFAVGILVGLIIGVAI